MSRAVASTLRHRRRVNEPHSGPTRRQAPMEFQDKRLTCVDCGIEFVWTVGEQTFFADKNFKNEPKRCKACKAKRASRPAGPGMRERVETATSCSACGKEWGP